MNSAVILQLIAAYSSWTWIFQSSVFTGTNDIRLAWPSVVMSQHWWYRSLPVMLIYANYDRLWLCCSRMGIRCHGYLLRRLSPTRLRLYRRWARYRRVLSTASWRHLILLVNLVHF